MTIQLLNAPPTVTTSTAKSITTTTATLGGNVTADGGVAVTARGVVWSTEENPDLTDSRADATSGGVGSYTVEATGLSPGVTYYARAFATNSIGTSYGSQVTFVAQQLAQLIDFAPLADREYSPDGLTIGATADSGLTVQFTSQDTTVCTVSGTTVTMLRSGTCTIRASQAGNVTYAAANPIDQSFEIAKAAQTIAFTVPTPRVYAPESFSVAASASTSASDVSLSVAFSSESEAVCTASGTDVTVVAAGTCTLTATQSGNVRYLAADPETQSFEITKRVLSLSGARAYDGTRDTPAAALTTVTNLFGSQTLTLSGGATTATPDVGARTLDISGIVLADGTNGGVASNYTLDGGTHVVTITTRPVHGAFTAGGRDYDGVTALDDALIRERSLGAVPGVSASGVVAVDGTVDDVMLVGGTATFASAAANEATPTTVTLTDASLGGGRAANYHLESVATSTATISRRPVTITGTFVASDRAYDGTVAATITTDGLVLANRIDGDDVSLNPVAAFDAPDAGQVHTVRLTDASTLTGAAAANYRIDLTGAPTATANITARTLTIGSGTFTVADKVYDGTDVATVSSSTLTLSGFASGDSMADITWSPSARFVDRTAGTGRTVTLLGGAVLGGPKGGGYTLDVTGAPTATASITPRPVTVTGASAATRPYDGSTAVTITGATLANTVAGDAVSLANATSGVAASRDAGTRAVSTSMTLTGAAAANYRLVGQPSLSVTITPLPVSVTMNALPARPYDGTTALPLGSGAFSVSGVRAGESIGVSGTAQLSSRSAGTRTVTLASPTFTPGAGTNLANYTLPGSVTGTVTVTPAPLTVVGATVSQRPFDGTTVATVTGARLEGVRGGDNVSLTGATRGVFASAQPGTHAVAFTPTLVGVDASSYTLVVPALSGTIVAAPATLRITGGLTQFADGSPRSVRAAVSPAGVGRITITYPGGSAPSAPGSYPVTVTLDSATHTAQPLSSTITIQPVEALVLPGLTATNGTTGTTGTGANGASTPEDEAAAERRREALIARIAVHSDGTLALPEIGPVLEADGSAPAFAPREHRVLEDGEPSTARIVVVEEQRVRIETDDASLALELQASISTPDGRVPLPVDADGTLLLDRGGFVEVGGTGFLAGSTAEVWMFSTATFLGTAIVDADGSFQGAFLIDDLLAAGEHTIQLNGTGADQRVRSTSLGVRIDDPENPSRERVVLASTTDTGIATTLTSPLWLALLAALLGAGVTRWWIAGRRRRDEDEDAGAGAGAGAGVAAGTAGARRETAQRGAR